MHSTLYQAYCLHLAPCVVLVLAICLLLFGIFLWFYLSPLLRNRHAVTAFSEQTQNSELLDDPLNEGERKKLLSWLYVRPGDRFIDSRNRIQSADSMVEKGQDGKHKFSPPSFLKQTRSSFSSFGRSSLVPYLSPPPPAYASHPGSPIAEFRFPEALDAGPNSSRDTGTFKTVSVPRIVFSASKPGSRSAYSIPLRSPSAPDSTRNGPPASSSSCSMVSTSSESSVASNATTTLRPFCAPRTVSDSTLHPASASLHIPSRAMVYNPSGSTDGGDRIALSRVMSVEKVTRIVRQAPTWMRRDRDIVSEGIGKRF